MAFRERFDSYVCEGDTITTKAGGFTVTARIVRDDCPDAPDRRQDGFWPSLDPQDAGFIGAGKGRAELDTATARARAVMDAWEQDEWFYCGVVLTVSRGGVELDSHAANLWGIEANYPDSDNAYLSKVADELLPEALDTARAALARLCAGCGYPDAEVAT